MMYEQKMHDLVLRRGENDRIACDLLKRLDPLRQLAILDQMDRALINRLFDIALTGEEYEICHMISVLQKEKNPVQEFQIFENADGVNE